jgi:hypothetical protein
MQTIYFRTTIGNTTRIEVGTIEEAQHYWDKLSESGFHMVSARP